MYRVRTIYDVIMLVVDLMRVSIENPKLVDGKVPPQLIRARKSVAIRSSFRSTSTGSSEISSPSSPNSSISKFKQRSTEIVTQLKSQNTIPSQRTTTISFQQLPSNSLPIYRQRSTEIKMGQETAATIDTDSLPPIKTEGYFQKISSVEVGSHTATQQLANDHNKGVEDALSRTKKVPVDVFITSNNRL